MIPLQQLDVLDSSTTHLGSKPVLDKSILIEIAANQPIQPKKNNLCFSLLYFPFDLMALLLILLVLLFDSSDIASVKLFVAAVSAWTDVLFRLHFKPYK